MASELLTIIDLLRAQVDASPNVNAIDEDGKHQYTYAQLWRSSQWMASALVSNERSDKSLNLVAICLDRSAYLICCAWGVLMSGQAYIFLDPADANNRNALMIKAFGIQSIITSKAHRNGFHSAGFELCNVRIVEDTVPDFQIAGPIFDLPNIDLASTAYVLQTSGSSGIPKGVVISHRAALPGVEAFGLDGQNRWLFLFNPIHSASQRLIIGVFCKGGTLCIVPKERLTELPEVLRSNRIEALGITPSLLKTLDPTNLPSCLQQITSISEPLPQSLADSFASHVELNVAYGLSEVAQLNIKRRFVAGDKSNLLAWPSDKTKVKILVPEAGNEVPPGEPGELCFIGPQLASGYLNREEETNKAFRDNPFGSGKMLRTGDEAHAMDTGFIITGRLDDMIKINGQKLEPGEVQAILDKQINVIQSRVVAVELQGVKSAVAAIQLKDGANWFETKLELLERASSNLPPYMIPKYWLKVLEIPQTVSGKLDKQKLIAQIKAMRLEDLRLRPPTQQETPMDKIESTIRRIFATVLNIEDSTIGLDSSFPDLGGDSMQAFEVISKLGERGYQTTLQSLVNRESIYNLRRNIKEIEEFPPTPPEFPAAARQVFPTTEFQKSLLMATMDMGSTAYTYQRLWDMNILERDKLQTCMNELVTNGTGTSLSLTFSEKDGEVVQSNTVRSFTIGNFEGSLKDYLIQDLARGFRYGEPFTRFTYVKDGEHSILVETRHHALFDYTSASLIYDDLATLYRGEQIVDRPRFHSFVDAVRQPQKDWSAAKNFWAANLQGSEPCHLNIIPVPGIEHTQRDLNNSIKLIADIYGVTESTVVTVAWAIVLSKQTGSRDVLFGATFSGRDEYVAGITNMRHMDGPTLTIAPLRFILDGKLREALRYGQNVWNSAREHSQYGLNKALSVAGIDAGHFDTLVNFVHVRKLGNDLFQYYGEKPIWKTDQTTLVVEKHQDPVTADVTYQVRLTGSMERRRLEFVVDQFLKVIHLMGSEGDKDLRYINTIGDAERKLLSKRRMFSGNPGSTLLSNFDRSVSLYPNNIAVQFELEESRSYQSLNETANRLARYLIDHCQVEPGDFVCTMFEKSIIATTAMIAILKAGAAFVPINPKSPPERRFCIIQDMNARIMLTTRNLCGRDQFMLTSKNSRGKDIGIEFVSLDSVDYDSYSEIEPDQVKIKSEDDAYVLFTSGSTGRPKAVPITHGAVSASIESALKFGNLCQYDRYLQFSDYVFDAAIVETFTIFGAGGTLCIPSEENRLSSLISIMDSMKVTHALLVPTIIQDIVQQRVHLPSLKQLNVGGEPLNKNILDYWLTEKSISVNQMYGPTETAIVSNIRVMKQDDMPNNIGSPLETVEQFVLRLDGTELVPYGAIGELCIAGAQLSKGYHNQPDLTRAAFVEINIGGASTVVYRTGDLARWLPDHEIQCLGRKDNQVKIIGKRVELCEIEAVFRSSKLVEDCAAVFLKDIRQIAMYIVFKASHAADEQQLRENLWAEISASPLMSYMTPRFLVSSLSLRKLDSTKLDRKYLQQDAEKRFYRKVEIDLSRYIFSGSENELQNHVALRTEEEQLLARCWATIFQSQYARNLGRRSHFVNTCGGDSMTAVMLSRCALNSGYRLPTLVIMKHPILEDMARELIKTEVLTPEGRSDFFTIPKLLQQDLDRVGISKDQYEFIYPCLPGQAEFLSQGERADRTWVLQTVRKIPDYFDIPQLERDYSTLTKLNEILRTTFKKVVGQWYGVVLADHRVAFECCKVANRAERDEQIDKLFLSSFSFGKPFLRYVVIQQPGRRELAIKLSHGLYDGTLLKILAVQLSDIRKGRHKESTSLFRNLALYHRNGLKKEKRDALVYFSAHEPSTCRLFGIDNPNASSYFSLDKTVGQLGVFAKTQGTTVPTIIQAAFQVVLSKFLGHSNVSYDSMFDGRHLPIPDQPHHDPAAANGPCVNFAPVTICVTGNIRDYIKETSHKFREAAEHAILNLDEIYTVWKLDRDLYQNQIMYVYQPYHFANLWMFQPLDDQKGEVTEENGGRWGTAQGLETKMRKPYVLTVEGCDLPRADQKRIKLSYDPRLFGEEGARQFTESMWEVIEKMTQSDPETSIEDLSPRAMITTTAKAL